MGQPVFTCERCGFSGPDGGSGCPRCATDSSRVPALAAPGSSDRFERTELEPGGSPPAGGYVDLDLGDEGDAAARGARPGPAAAPRRRAGERTLPSFAAVPPPAPKANSAVPVLAAVGAGCLALIAAGAFIAGREPASAAPAPAAQAEAAPAGAQPAPPRADVHAAAPAAPAATPVAAPRAVTAPPAAAPRPERRARPEPAPARVPAVPAARAAPVVVAAVETREPAPEAAPSSPAPAATVAAAAPVPLPPPPAPIEDAPRYPTEGFRRPQMAEPGCVQRSIRLPRDAAARVEGPVTVKFAVGTSGEVGLFQVLGAVVDPRVRDALATAVRNCGFIPGADAQGTPTRLWVTMPIRFER